MSGKWFKCKKPKYSEEEKRRSYVIIEERSLVLTNRSPMSLAGLCMSKIRGYLVKHSKMPYTEEQFSSALINKSTRDELIVAHRFFVSGPNNLISRPDDFVFDSDQSGKSQEKN